MIKYIIIAFAALISFQSLNAQVSGANVSLDSLYREDQIYLSVTYNILGSKPQGVSQNGFSSGFHFGFIRDFPINEKRNIALGLGLGLSANSFNQNLKISKNDSFEFQVLNSGDFDKNKFALYLVELPFEFRWRTSTAETYNFWRIYTGLKLGYVLLSKSKFIGPDESFNININDVINRIQYGLTISVGYDSWNFHLYYSLNSIFKDQSLNGKSIDVNSIKAGLIFYML